MVTEGASDKSRMGNLIQVDKGEYPKIKRTLADILNTAILGEVFVEHCRRFVVQLDFKRLHCTDHLSLINNKI